MKWQEFKASEHFGLIQNKSVDLKLFDGRVISVYQVVGVTILDNKGENISYQDIGWFCPKKDWQRYKEIQKSYEVLNKLDADGDVLDEIDWAIHCSLSLKFSEKRTEKLRKAFKTIRNCIEKAKEEVINESKTFL